MQKPKCIRRLVLLNEEAWVSNASFSFWNNMRGTAVFVANIGKLHQRWRERHTARKCPLGRGTGGQYKSLPWCRIRPEWCGRHIYPFSWDIAKTMCVTDERIGCAILRTATGIERQNKIAMVKMQTWCMTFPESVDNEELSRQKGNEARIC